MNVVFADRFTEYADVEPFLSGCTDGGGFFLNVFMRG